MFLNGASKKHRKLQGLSWERGDPGVGTLRSAAGAARHYNLRLPTEGLRQGHGRGRRPDFRMHVIGGRSDEFNDFKFEGSGTRSPGKTGEGAWKRQGL